MTVKERFIGGRAISALDFFDVAKAANVKIAKNIANQIDNKVENIQIIYGNGTSRISGYGLRTNTLLAIGRVVANVYRALA